MSEEQDSAEQDREELLALTGTLNGVTRDLIQNIRSSLAPKEQLLEAIAKIEEAKELLSPWVVDEPGWSTISIGSKNSGLPWLENDITSIMPYSPVSGRHNPVAPPMKLWRDGDEVRGETQFNPTYAGPPDSVHGGFIAAVFDEVLAMANVISGTAGFTGTLKIRYHSTTPLNTPVQLSAINVRRDGRKQVCTGEMRVGDKVTASAEGLFICAADSEVPMPS